MDRRKALVIAVGFFVLGCFSAVPSFAAREGTFHRSLEVSGPVDIDLTTGSGNVTVRTGTGGRVEITGHIRASGWFDGAQDRVSRLEANPPIQQSGNSIRIGHIQDPDLRRNISISYELLVPAQTQLTSHSGSGGQDIDGLGGMVDVNAGSGDLHISNIGNTVRAETGSGDMKLENVRGEVHAKTGSGSIRATDIAGGFEGETGSGHIELQQSAPGSVRVKTGSGGIEARGVRGSLEARAGSGEITAEGDPRGGWIVHTGSGSVRLRLAAEAAFDLNAHTSSGSISMSRPVTVQGMISRKEIRGRVHGGGPQVEVQTSSGNIEIL
jgi:DUF4097 and DUF4098 domain-containing protein YvlB